MKFNRIFSHTNKVAAISLLAMSITTSCSDDDPKPDPDGNGNGNGSVPTDWTAPTYADDYSAIAAWSKRNNWNLANVHDPSVAYFDGKYFMYCTDASYGNEHAGHGHFHGRYSEDLVNWKYLNGSMSETPPAWIAEKLNEIRTDMGLNPIAEKDIQYGYWAPVVRTVKKGGKDILRMYYSVIIDNYIGNGKPNTTANFDNTWVERAFIGVCESEDPLNNKWVDKGFVVCSSSDKGLDYSRKSTSNWDGYFYFNAIDPTYIVTPEGQHWLIYGSWHSGFAALEIDAESGLPKNAVGKPYGNSPEEIASYGTRVSTRNDGSRWQGSEGPDIIYKDGYYYLFIAYDGLDIPYNTRVVRSENVTGPYVDITGRNNTNGRGDCYPIVTHPYKFNNHSGWVGISHCGVFQNETTKEWFFTSQGRLPEGTNGNSYANAIMMGQVRKIVWCPSAQGQTDLWPIALPERYAGVPDYGKITRDSLVGKWEHINLEYKFREQCKSSALTLAASGKATGSITGDWSYDEATKQLTIGKYVVCVERELDWEANPRVPTLVFAGCDKNEKITLWGKKTK